MMKREIKFRAWDKRDGLQKMLYLTGFVPYGEGWSGGNPDYKFYELYYGLNAFMKVSEKEIEIMQFTGLKDGHGKEIYEGDICEGHSDGIGVITWSPFDGGYDYVFSDEANVGIWEVIKFIKVIGNVYQNPELLTP